MAEQVVIEREPAPTLMVPGGSTPPPAAPKPQLARRYELPPDKPVATPAPVAATPEKPAAPAVEGEQKPAGEAPAAEPEATKPEETPEDAEKRRQSRRFERRLDKAYRKAAEERARNELLARENEQLRQSLKPQAVTEPGAPTLEQFEYDAEKYAAAKAKYETDKALKAREQEARVAKQREFHQTLVTSWEEKASRGEDKYPDFEEKVGTLDASTPLGAAIMTAENGEEIAYHLATNMKEAQRLAALDPFSQVREIGKLEAKLALQAEKPKPASKAPAPIAPVTGTTPAATNSEPSDEDDMKTWMAKRQKQVARPGFRR